MHDKIKLKLDNKNNKYENYMTKIAWKVYERNLYTVKVRDLKVCNWKVFEWKICEWKVYQ